MPEPVRLAVGSVSLSTGFGGVLYAHLKKQLQPGETIVDCATLVQHETDLSRSRLLQILEGTPKPVALIALLIRPGPEVIAAYRAAGAPVVIVDESAEGASTVASDNLAGGYLAGQHLAKLGRRSVAIVSGRSQIAGGYSASQRQRGLRRALAEAGPAFHVEDVIEVVEYSRKDGVNAMRALLARPQHVDAIFCAAGDLCATGMLAVARERGVAVPGDVAIVGYDDNALAAISDPPLTTVRQPVEAMVHEAHRLATQAREEILARPVERLLSPTLIVRQSA